MKQSTANTARGLSGEIMTPPLNSPRRLRPVAVKDVVEAEFEIAPGLTAIHLATLRVAQPGPVVTMGRQRRSGGAGFWSVGLLAVGCAFWFSGGSAYFAKPVAGGLAMATPQPELADITSSIDRSGNAAVVMVDGAVVNPGIHPSDVPPIAIAVTGANATTTRYLLSAASARIEPGKQFAFSGRLALPKEGAETVRVEFAD